MRGCVSFQIKVQILAFYTDVCAAPKDHYDKSIKFEQEFQRYWFVQCLIYLMDKMWKVKPGVRILMQEEGNRLALSCQ